MPGIQDIVALAVAVAAAAWLASTFRRSLSRPGCGKKDPSPPPAGADGFVPLDQLSPRK